MSQITAKATRPKGVGPDETSTARDSSMYPVKKLQLLLAVLLPLAAYSGPADLSETSGEELQDVAEGVENRKWHFIARNLQLDITRLRDEQFQKNFGEPVENMTNYATVRIQTPLISPSNGCMSRNFSAQRCLKRIYNGLRTYREYLDYVERENLTSAQLTHVKEKTTRLLNIIKDKVEDIQIQPSSISALPDGSAWTQRTVIHSVLYNLATFMTDTTRAINYMNKKGINHISKEPKESKWPSEKHSHE